MRRTLAITLLALVLLPAARLGAQDPVRAEEIRQGVQSQRVSVRTFPLQSLSPGDAAKLTAPYVMGTPQFGVYEAGGAVAAITVRATLDILTRIDSLLRANDHPRATIVLRFQLIAASDSAVHDPAIAAIDAELRNLFRFAGYRLLSQGAAIVSAPEHFAVTMPGSRGEMFLLDGEVEAVQLTAGKGSARLRVWLKTRTGAFTTQGQFQVTELFSTGLTVPLEQTAVLGTAATNSGIPALILVVKPERQTKP